MDSQTLSHAIKNGNLKDVKTTLNTSTDVVTLLSASSAAGLTPLASAVLQGQYNIVHCLLEAGADPSVGYKADWVDKTQHDICLELIEHSPPLHCAAIRGSAELIKLLAAYGADVNLDNGLDKGSNVVPLQVATGAAVETLILAQANIERENNHRWTPLIYAISRQDIEAIRVLVKHGAKVDTDLTTRYKVRVANGEEKLVLGTSSPMMVACGHGRLTDQSANIVEILVAAGAEVNRRYTVELGSKDETLPSFTLLSLICESRAEKPQIRSPHAITEDMGWGEKELQVVRLLLQLGASREDLKGNIKQLV